MKLTYKQHMEAQAIWYSRHFLPIQLKSFIEVSITNLRQSEHQLKRKEITEYLSTLSYLITLGVHAS